MATTAPATLHPAAQHLLDLELLLNGALMNSASHEDAGQWPRVRDLLVPQDFIEPLHAEIWRAFQETEGRADLPFLLARFPQAEQLLVAAYDKALPHNAPLYAAELRRAADRRAIAGLAAADHLSPAEMKLALNALAATIHGAEPVAGPVPQITAADLLAQPLVPRSWNVRDLIPAATITTLDGDGGTGKSTLGLQLCVATAAGRRWLNREVLQGPALFVSAEDDADELRRRLSDMAVHFDLGRDDLRDLHVFALADRDAEFVVPDTRDRKLSPTSIWRELEERVRSVAPVLVVLDSRADLFGGDEVNRQQVRAFIAMLRRLASSSGAGILLLSHPSVAGMASGTGLSGSTAWNNSVRSRLYFSKPKPDDSGDYDPDARVLRPMKSNYSALAPDIRLHRRGGVFLTDDDGAPPTRLNRQAEHSRADVTFMQLLAKYRDAGRNVSATKTAPNYAPTLFANDPDAQGITKAGFAAAMERRFSAGALRVETFGPRSHQRQRLVAVEGAK